MSGEGVCGADCGGGGGGSGAAALMLMSKLTEANATVGSDAACRKRFVSRGVLDMCRNNSYYTSVTGNTLMPFSVRATVAPVEGFVRSAVGREDKDRIVRVFGVLPCKMSSSEDRGIDECAVQCVQVCHVSVGGGKSDNDVELARHSSQLEAVYCLIIFLFITSSTNS